MARYRALSRAERALGWAPRTAGNKGPRGISVAPPGPPGSGWWLKPREQRREWAVRRRRDETRLLAARAGAWLASRNEDRRLHPGRWCRRRRVRTCLCAPRWRP